MIISLFAESNTPTQERQTLKSLIIRLIISSFFLFFLLFNQADAASQNLMPSPKKSLRVGILTTQPYSYFVHDKPIGIAYDLWLLIARDNNFDCQYINIGNNINSAISKVKRGEIDVLVGHLALLSSREEQGYFSLPFFQSQFVLLAKKVPVNIATRVYQTFKSVPLSVVGFVFIIYLIYIILFYVFERDKQPELIPLSNKNAFELILWRNILSGLRGAPFFPRTRLLRTLSLIWSSFFVSLLFSFLAGITSAFIAGWTSSGKQLIHLSDLDNKFVDAEGGGNGMAVVTAQRIGLNVPIFGSSIDDAVKRLDHEDVAAIIVGRLVAVTYLKTHLRNDLYISTIELPSYSVGYLFNENHESLLRGVNYSILKATETGEKMLICKKYLGSLGEHVCL